MHRKRTIKIVSTGRALPKKCLSNFDLEAMVDTNDEWIQTRTGIKNRYLCEEEDVVSLAVEASKVALARAKECDDNFSEEKLIAVLVATSTGEYRYPSTACLVQKQLGLKSDVLAFDMSAACSGFIYGLITANGLLKGKTDGYILLVGSEHLSKTVDYTDRGTCILFGDGAGATVLKRIETEAFDFTYVAGSDGNDEVLACRDNGKMVMKGQEVFRFATRVLYKGIKECLKETNLEMNDIDYIVCHQANMRIIEHVQKKFKGFEDRFYINIADYGNTSAASIPIALDEMAEKGMLKAGMKILMVGFGAGLTWGSAIVTV